MKKLRFLFFSVFFAIVMSVSMYAADETIELEVPVTILHDAEQQFLKALNDKREELGLNRIPTNGYMMQEAEMRAAEIILDMTHGHPDNRTNDYTFAEMTGTHFTAKEDVCANWSTNGKDAFNQFFNETANGHSADMKTPNTLVCGVGIVQYAGTTFVVYEYCDATSFTYPYTVEDMKNTAHPTSGSVEKTFKIKMLKSAIKLAAPVTFMEYGESRMLDYVYIRNAYEPYADAVPGLRIDPNECTITGDGKVFSVTGKTVKAIGTGTGTLTIKWPKKGIESTYSVEVRAADIANSTVDPNAVTLEKTTYTYTGKPIEPVVKKVVDLNGNELKEGIDYTISYSNNTEIGRGKVKINAMGNYRDYVIAYFNIVAPTTPPSTGGNTGGNTSGGSTSGSQPSSPNTPSVGGSSSSQTPSPNTPAAPAKPAVPAPVKVGQSVNIGAGRYTVGKSNTVRYDGPTNPNVTTVTIPNTVTVNGKAHKVTSIKEKAFSKNKKVKKITIGKYVKGIGKYAFYGTTNLRKLVIKSSSIKSVGGSAFKKAGYKKGSKLVVDVPNKKISAYRTLFRKKKLYVAVKVK